MKPARFLLPIFLSVPVVFPLLQAIAVNPPQGFKAVDELIDTLSDPDAEQISARNEEFKSVLVSKSNESEYYVANLPQQERAGVIRFGDTLMKLAKRYSMSLNELLHLNPGLKTANLVVGNHIRIAQSSKVGNPQLLALAPVGSGGLSWPDTPNYEEKIQKPFPIKKINTSWMWPSEGILSSSYGWRWGRMHKGIDVANNVGTPIVAAKSGVVTFAGWHSGGYGYLLEITHHDGSLSLYGHNSILLVRKGQKVDQGQLISKMGSTGRSTGPHLHFEIHPAGKGASNPMSFLPPRA